MATKKTRKIHSDEFKAEVLKLAAQTTVAGTARQLGLHESLIYQWCFAFAKKSTSSERESMLATENARLKRLLAEQAEVLDILKKAATYFARNEK